MGKEVLSTDRYASQKDMDQLLLGLTTARVCQTFVLVNISSSVFFSQLKFKACDHQLCQCKTWVWLAEVNET